ncbi:MAG: outer membrane lipoprotein chaperone LolA [Aquabacterium sp.]|nr:MAG: outer membrane lipoprotein chaperone LolA [Aquabacterium sp.]
MNSSGRLAALGALAATLFSVTGVVNVAYAVGEAKAAEAADAVAMLRHFVKDVQTARANFTQVVTSPDGKKTRKSTGTLEFQRPDKFRFAYAGPTEQLIVGDGKKVWLYDTDLNQVTVRPMSATIGASPAALLAGGSLDKDFTLKAVAVTAGSSSAAAATSTPSQATSSLEWVEALPRHKDGQFQSVRVGFTKNGPQKGQLAALEILDSFGQRSRLDFAQFESKVVFPTTRFQFTPPAGADVLNQP